MFCQNCGNQINENAEFCMHCGIAIEEIKNPHLDIESREYLGGHDKISMALICFFLGGFGVHNFIMGEQKKGFTKIAMCFVFGISGLLALIDFIKILTDKYEVDYFSCF